MDNKRVLTTALLMFAIAMGWFWLVTYLDRRNPEWNLMGRRPAATQPATPPAPVADGGQGAAPAIAAPVSPGASQPAPDAAVASATAPAAARPAVELAPVGTPTSHVLGSTAYKDETFSMGVALSPRAAGIESVTLNQFRQVVGKPEPYIYQQPLPGLEDVSRGLSVQAVRIDGERISLTGAQWGLIDGSQTQATYGLEVRREGVPLVRIERVYRLATAAATQDQARGYELSADTVVRNLSPAPLEVSLEIAGPVAPPKELDRTPDQNVLAGYYADGLTRIEQHIVDGFRGGKTVLDLSTSSKGQPLAWVGTGSAYFDAILRPVPLKPGEMTPAWVETVTARANTADDRAVNRMVNVSLITRPQSIAGGESISLPVKAFFIPKQRSLVGSTYFKAPPLEFHRSLVNNAGPCGICVLDIVVDTLVAMLRAFFFILRDWGLAIIALVVLVRLLLHPLTKASQTRMMKMAKMAPEIERLKKKYADDKEALQKAMAKHQMEQFPAMMLGCLPMIIQMPIWIALYSALQTTFELRQAPFLRHAGINLTWIKDLAKPDRLIYFPDRALEFYFPLCGEIHLDSLNLLPLLLGVVFFLQQKLTPKPPPADEQQAMQQKMMQWMVLPFALLMYNLPSGLNLYILTSTTIGIIESKRIRDHVRRQDELEAAGVVVADAPAGKKSKIGGFMGDLFERVQKMAEDAKAQQQTPPGGGRKPGKK